MPQFEVNREWRVQRVINMTQGLAIPPATDSQAEQFQNFEVLADGSVISRLGAFTANTNSLNSNLIVGFHRTEVALSGTITDIVVAAKKGTTWAYATAPFGAPQAWTSLTAPQDPGLNVVVGENCLNLSETNLALFASAGFAPGICSWDGTTFSTIAQAPNNVRYLRQFNQVTYAVTTAKPNRIYFSNNSDPLTWAGTSFFDIPANKGVITGLELFPAGTLLVFCTRGIFGVFGDPVQAQETVEVLHDSIGCDTPTSIFTVEAVTIFAFRGSLFAFSGGVQEQTPLLRGITRGVANPAPGKSGRQLLIAIDQDRTGGAQAWALNQATGQLTAVGSTVGTRSNGGATVVDPLGRFVYQGNLVASLAGLNAYSIGTNGALSLVSTFDVGKNVLTTAMHPNGRTLFTASQT